MKHIDDALQSIEGNRSIITREAAIEALRSLGLTDFGLVLTNMPDPRYPRLSALLPKFASEEVQLNWTGSSGQVLLGQSLSFFRSLIATNVALTGVSLNGKKILDYGCGYGRLLRLANFYSHDVWGVDPWDVSIDLCKEAGINTNVFVSEYLPTDLPVPRDFDLAYAFSVFTHLSERATRAALAAVHKHLLPNRIFCITIRPIEYWRYIYDTVYIKDGYTSEFVSRHEAAHASGFTFQPHNRQAVDGDITYGDSSMSLEWLGEICSSIGWDIVGTDRSLEDSLQRYVFLRRR